MSRSFFKRKNSERITYNCVFLKAILKEEMAKYYKCKIQGSLVGSGLEFCHVVRISKLFGSLQSRVHIPGLNSRASLQLPNVRLILLMFIIL